MRNLTIATFISNKEKINHDFFEFIEDLINDIRVEVIVYTDYDLNFKKQNYRIKQVVSEGKTKYSRIIHLLNNAMFNKILCIDNDVRIEWDNLKIFIRKCFDKDYDLAWGKIKTYKQRGIISRLVEVDKTLSHDILRPSLWKMKIGISVPGQIFFLDRNKFHLLLEVDDTVFDDLTIGICAKENGLSVYSSNLVLGFENPKLSTKELIKQRKRWAQGFAETLYNNKKNKMLTYILIHGFIYHLLWVLAWLIILAIAQANRLFGIFAWLAVCSILLKGQIGKLLWGMLYSIVFPLLHLMWLMYCIKSYRKL